jgi:hypothetical protein
MLRLRPKNDIPTPVSSCGRSFLTVKQPKQGYFTVAPEADNKATAILPFCLIFMEKVPS